MEKPWRRAAPLAALAAVVAVSAFAHEPVKSKMAKGSKTLWAASDVQWSPMAGLAGAQESVLWGDPKAGEHGILYKWPAGTSVPVHWHTNGDHGVVISGTMTLAVEGAAPKELPPGSYFSLAGGVRHATTCKPGADCVFFIHREGPFDVQGLPPAPAAANK